MKNDSEGLWLYTGRAIAIDSKGEEAKTPDRATGFVLRDKPIYAGMQAQPKCVNLECRWNLEDGVCRNADCHMEGQRQ